MLLNFNLQTILGLISAFPSIIRNFVAPSPQIEANIEKVTPPMAQLHTMPHPEPTYATSQPEIPVYHPNPPQNAQTPKEGRLDGLPAPITPVLFYVQALYDYTATIDEEFDFQAGDIIAVTATPEDGWWSGELLDEARRQKGKNVFPSNFVSLF